MVGVSGLSASLLGPSPDPLADEVTLSNLQAVAPAPGSSTKVLALPNPGCTGAPHLAVSLSEPSWHPKKPLLDTMQIFE